eukprot:TRINITY_DN7330_c0_g1_i1.p1 TRINITY_DN7330_c0_g1~~TRINITY_DN7330_c0_g1_i1.p1  ORF type:complete len:435 (+),score=89.83 TRINITY_DN7330_c0_g1_i1:195-1499(+)
MSCACLPRHYIFNKWRPFPMNTVSYPGAINLSNFNVSHPHLWNAKRHLSLILPGKGKRTVQEHAGLCKKLIYRKYGGLSVNSERSLKQNITITRKLNALGNEHRNDRLMLIDGTAMIHRAYYKIMAQLHHGGMEHADGNGDWVLTTFKALSLVLEMLQLGPSHIAVIFDYDGTPFRSQNSNLCQEAFLGKGRTFRHTLYPSYKSHRNPTPDTVVQALQYLKAALESMSLKVIEVPGVEADDVIGTLTVNGVDAGFKVRIVSPDKDFFQLLGPSVRILRMASNESRTVSFGMEDFAKLYGHLVPSQIVDVMALAGDTSDNIPGVKGIGPVKALKLITEFGSLERLLQNIDQLPDDALRQALMSQQEEARISKELATLRSDLPYYMVPFKLDDLLFQRPEDGGEKFKRLLDACSAYSKGSSCTRLVQQALALWEKN